MLRFLPKFLLNSIWIVCMSFTSYSQFMPNPEVDDFPSSLCIPSGTLSRKITNMPDFAYVIVNINNDPENYYIGESIFKFEARSAPTDTVTIYFINGSDTTFKEFVFDVGESFVLPVYETICSSELPYFWKDNYYFYEGVFNDLSGLYGVCDTMEQLHLTVNPTSTIIVNKSVCTSALPYIWNGISVTSPGIGVASYTTLSINGCDSVTFLNLTTQSTKYKTVTDTTCFDDLPFLWNGISVSVGGVGAATYTTGSAAGCDSIVTLNLYVGYNFAVNYYDTICASELPYMWQGFPVFSGGSGTSYLTTTVVGCDSLVTLNLTVRPVLNMTVVDTICNSDLPYLWNGISVLDAGTSAASFTMSSIFGCDSTTTLNLVIGAPVSVNQNVTICNNELPYLWNGISVTAPGTAVATYTAATSLGCDSITYLNLVSNPTYRDTTVLSACAGSLPIVWNGLLVDSFGVGTSIYNGTTIKGCDSIKVLNLIEIPTVVVNETKSVCVNDFPYIVYGNSFSTAGSYTYSKLGGDGCDTLVLLTLESLPLPYTEESLLVCLNDFPLMWNGISVEAPGIRVAGKIYPKDIGCDSMRWLNVATIDPPMAPIIALSVADLGVVNVVSGALYQWEIFNEVSGLWEEIVGATGPIFVATLSGKYRVAAHNDDCDPVYSSELEVEIVTSGIHSTNSDFEKTVTLYPNPTKHLVNVQFGSWNNSVNIEIVDIHGRLLLEEKNVDKEIVTIDVQSLSAGIYLLNIIDHKTHQTLGIKKLVVEK